MHGCHLTSVSRFKRIHLITVALVVSCLLTVISGCATSTLVKEARGQINTIDKIKVLKINSAYLSEDSSVVNICMNTLDITSEIRQEKTLHLPLRNHFRWDVRHSLEDSNNNVNTGGVPSTYNATYVGFTPMAKDLTVGCENHGRRISVYDLSSTISPFSEEDKVKSHQFILPKGESDALYVIDRDGMPENFGYISSKMLITDAYSIDISADNMLDMTTRKNQKPYMYVFVPIAAAVDTVAVTATAYVMWIIGPYIHNASPQ